MSSHKEMEISKSAGSTLIYRKCKVTKGTHILHFITSLSALNEGLRKIEQAAEEGATQTERQKLKGNKLFKCSS